MIIREYKASLFGSDMEMSNKEKSHPIYETIKAKAATNAQILMPINDQNRNNFKVTNKVFWKSILMFIYFYNIT